MEKTDVDLKKYIGRQIKMYRQKKGLYQRDLGKLIGVENNTISSYERGITSPGQNTLFKIAKVLDIKVDDLFPSNDNKKDDLHRALELAESQEMGLDIEDMMLIKRITEKALSLNSADRKRLMDSIRFAADYFENMND